MTGQTGATAVLRQWCHWAAPSLTDTSRFDDTDEGQTE